MVEKCLMKTQLYENKNSKRLSAHCVGMGQGSFEKVWDKLRENVKQQEQQRTKHVGLYFFFKN